MTIYTSCLPNDADMNRALGSLALPLPIATGDACFSGLGDNGQPILVCVERKKVSDLVSCILNGRYNHQLQIARSNGADVFCLIVEGTYRPSPEDGLVEVPVWGINPRTLRRGPIWKPVKPAIAYSRLDQYLTELSYLVGVIVKRSRDVQETAAIIKALWDNFQTPPEKHNSLHAIYKTQLNTVLLMPPSLVRRVAAEFDGIGWEWSRAAADRFHSVREMVSASVSDWARLEHVSDSGKHRRLGKRTAEKVVTALHNGGGKK